MTILDEAKNLVYGDRQADYGHPLDNFTTIARLWSVILGVDITAEQVALCMVQVKIARQLWRPKRDNLVDACGYAATLELVQDERKRRETIKCESLYGLKEVAAKAEPK